MDFSANTGISGGAQRSVGAGLGGASGVQCYRGRQTGGKSLVAVVRMAA
jgi:hypothetical protein